MKGTKLPDEPSSTEVRGLVVSVEYRRNDHALESGRWSATLRHRNLGAVTSHGPTPSQARAAARERLHDDFDSMMHGHQQRHAHEV
jgi:hypothetical protein